MAKPVVKFVCTTCGAQYSAWAGKCAQCDEWNTLEEEAQIVTSANGVKTTGRKLSSQTILASEHTREKRLVTTLADIDMVLGGGFVPGSVVLLAGQPGIGKSTLLLQLAGLLAQQNDVLYVSGEESAHQVGMRAERLGVTGERLSLATTSSADDIAATIAAKEHRVVIVDSIQTVSMNSVTSAPGSVSQITNCTHLLLTAAKATNTLLILVGHVTKEGTIAGPKILEHIVDVVLQFEGENYGGFKVLRAAKNRFGSTTETAILEMVETGLRAVDNPSAALLAERQVTDGSVVLATVEGTRAVLVEVQALVNKTSYGYPKRAASGIDLNRVNLLVAVLERRTKLNLADLDIYINIVGGLKLSDPAADLAICMAIGSAAKGLRLSKNAAIYGEVGLSGEIRHVSFAEKRIAEARKLGLDVAVGPAARNLDKSSATFLDVVPDVRTALNKYLEK
ncbi:MAG: DNA repair protein RadA [Candidatus Saccharimonadales bacterium]